MQISFHLKEIWIEDRPWDKAKETMPFMANKEEAGGDKSYM